MEAAGGTGLFLISVITESCALLIYRRRFHELKHTQLALSLPGRLSTILAESSDVASRSPRKGDRVRIWLDAERERAEASHDPAERGPEAA
jgi:hypothetical protein